MTKQTAKHKEKKQALSSAFSFFFGGGKCLCDIFQFGCIKLLSLHISSSLSLNIIQAFKQEPFKPWFLTNALLDDTCAQ